jgi:hypothetical protein
MLDAIMTTDGAAHDPDTLAFYDREANAYAARAKPERNRRLEDFLSNLAKGSKILELGCGDGRDSETMIRSGFDVTPTDGSPGLARVAGRMRACCMSRQIGLATSLQRSMPPCGPAAASMRATSWATAATATASAATTTFPRARR